MAYYLNQHHAGFPSQSAAAAAAAMVSAGQQGHHAGRNMRAPRLSSSSSSQNSQKHFRAARGVKDLPESSSMLEWRARFEAGRSFDLDDDLEFCPGLLTEDDIHSIHSASSDRSSLSSDSPEGSPLQHQIQPQQQVTPAFSLASTSNSFIPSSYVGSSQVKLAQTAAMRSKNAIPIVNPSTGMRVQSPPLSVSPARLQQHQQYGRRW